MGIPFACQRDRQVLEVAVVRCGADKTPPPAQSLETGASIRTGIIQVFDDLRADDDVEGFGCQQLKQISRGEGDFETTLGKCLASQFNPALTQVHTHNLAAPLGKLAARKTIPTADIKDPGGGAEWTAKLKYLRHEMRVHVRGLRIVKLEVEIGIVWHIIAIKLLRLDEGTQWARRNGA